MHNLFKSIFRVYFFLFYITNLHIIVKEKGHSPWPMLQIFNPKLQAWICKEMTLTWICYDQSTI